MADDPKPQRSSPRGHLPDASCIPRSMADLKYDKDGMNEKTKLFYATHVRTKTPFWFKRFQPLPGSKVRTYSGRELTMEKFKSTSLLRKVTHFYDGDKTVIVYEGGCIPLTSLKRCARLEDHEKPLTILLQIAQALKFLHGHCVTHRNLTREAVFLFENADRVALGDFRRLLFHPQGTTAFCLDNDDLSPEQINKQDQGPPVDVFAFGNFIIDLLAGKSFITDRESVLVTAQAASKGQLQKPLFCSALLDKLWPLVQKCLQEQPGDRPTMDQVLSDPVFRCAKEQMRADTFTYPTPGKKAVGPVGSARKRKVVDNPATDVPATPASDRKRFRTPAKDGATAATPVASAVASGKKPQSHTPAKNVVKTLWK